MKKLITLAFIALMTATFVGCEQKSTPPATSGGSTNAASTNAP